MPIFVTIGKCEQRITSEKSQMGEKIVAFLTCKLKDGPHLSKTVSYFWSEHERIDIALPMEKSFSGKLK